MSFNFSTLNLPTLQKNSKGTLVTAWQQFLLESDYPIAAVDGDFGNVTDMATRDYQTKNGLTVDGRVDNTVFEQALTQGFAVYFTVYTNSAAKLLAYLNFGIDEVKDLQQSLSAIASLSPPLQVDGDFGTNSSRGLAEAYKNLDTNFGTKLTTQLANNTKLKLAADFAPALDIINDYAKRLRQRLSGKHWVSFFANSNSIDDLASPFRQRVQAFKQALTTAGANIAIASTLRPPQRAYLMHYAFNIKAREIAPENVPPMLDVDINWVHYTAQASLKAAQDMVATYNIAYAPALNSRPIQGLAIDWDITWSGTLNIKNASGTNVSIDTPRSGFTNSQLWDIGVSYGVKKLISDQPHWSSDGH